MATEPLIELGSNYGLDEDSNGDLVIRDQNGNAVLTYDDANTRWELAQDMVPATDGAEQLGATGKAFGQLVSNAVGNDGSSLSVGDDLDLQSAQSITNASSVSTDEINSIVNAANYSNFADAIVAAQGGVLWLPPDDYDVANYGRLTLAPSDDVSVRGVPGDIVDGYGTRLINTGTDRVTSGPIVAVDGDATTRRNNREIRGLGVQNDAAIAGFEIRDAPSTRVVDCLYDGLSNGQADVGFRVVGESYSSQFLNCEGTSHGGNGSPTWLVNHKGGAIDLDHCGGVTRTAAPAFEIIGEGDVQGRGGQAGGSGIGIKMAGQGHSWIDSRIENADTAVQFGDANNTANDCRVVGPFFGGINDDLLRIVSGSRNEFSRPRQTMGTTNGYVIESGDDNVLDLDITASKRGFSDSGRRTVVKLSERTGSTVSRDEIGAKTPGTRVYVDGTGLQMWDGSQWVTVQSGN